MAKELFSKILFYSIRGVLNSTTPRNNHTHQNNINDNPGTLLPQLGEDRAVSLSRTG